MKLSKSVEVRTVGVYQCRGWSVTIIKMSRAGTTGITVTFELSS